MVDLPPLPPLLCVHCLTGECVHEPRRKHTVAAVGLYRGDSCCAACLHIGGDVLTANELPDLASPPG